MDESRSADDVPEALGIQQVDLGLVTEVEALVLWLLRSPRLQARQALILSVLLTAIRRLPFPTPGVDVALAVLRNDDGATQCEVALSGLRFMVGTTPGQDEAEAEAFQRIALSVYGPLRDEDEAEVLQWLEAVEDLRDAGLTHCEIDIVDRTDLRIADLLAYGEGSADGADWESLPDGDELDL